MSLATFSFLLWIPHHTEFPACQTLKWISSKSVTVILKYLKAPVTDAVISVPWAELPQAFPTLPYRSPGWKACCWRLEPLPQRLARLKTALVTPDTSFSDLCESEINAENIKVPLSFDSSTYFQDFSASWTTSLFASLSRVWQIRPSSWSQVMMTWTNTLSWAINTKRLHTGFWARTATFQTRKGPWC